MILFAIEVEGNEIKIFKDLKNLNYAKQTLTFLHNIPHIVIV